jgi:TP901 family phage tail tape measure protein
VDPEQFNQLLDALSRAVDVPHLNIDEFTGQLQKLLNSLSKAGKNLEGIPRLMDLRQGLASSKPGTDPFKLSVGEFVKIQKDLKDIYQFLVSTSKGAHVLTALHAKKTPSQVTLKESQQFRQLNPEKQHQEIRALLQAIASMGRDLREVRSREMSAMPGPVGKKGDITIAKKQLADFHEALNELYIESGSEYQKEHLKALSKMVKEKKGKKIPLSQFDKAGVDFFSLQQSVIEKQQKQYQEELLRKAQVTQKEEVAKVSEIVEGAPEGRDVGLVEAMEALDKVQDKIYTVFENLEKEVIQAIPEEKQAEMKKKSEEIAQNLTGAIADTSKLFDFLKKESGGLEESQVKFLQEAMKLMPESTLGAPVARAGAERGYHARSLFMPYGTAMHMMMTAEALTKGYEGYESPELARLKRELMKSPRDLQAAIMAGALHDITKYLPNLLDTAMPFTYDPAHGVKGGILIQEQLMDKLNRLLGRNYAERVVEAIQLHHLRPAHLQRFIEKAVAEEAQMIDDPTERVKYFTKTLYKYGIGYPIEITEESITEYVKRIEKAAESKPDFTQTIGDLQNVLEEADLQTLGNLQKKLKDPIIQAVQAADGLMAQMTQAMPSSEIFLSMMESVGALSSEHRAEIEKLSPKAKELYQKYLMDQMSFLTESVVDPVGRIGEVINKFKTVHPVLMENLTKGPLSQLVKTMEDIEKLSVVIPQSEFESYRRGIGERLQRLDPRVAPTTKIPAVEAAKMLGVPTYLGKGNLEPVERFLQYFGRIDKIVNDTGVSFTEFIRNLATEFESQLATGTVREDIAKTMMIYPDLFEKLRQTVEARLGKAGGDDLYNTITDMEKFYKEFVRRCLTEALEAEGVNLLTLTRKLSGKSDIKFSPLKLGGPPPEDPRLPRHELADVSGRRVLDPKFKAATDEMMQFISLGLKYRKISREHETGLPKELMPRDWQKQLDYIFGGTFKGTEKAIVDILPKIEQYVDLLYKEAEAKGTILKTSRVSPEEQELAEQWATKQRLAKARGIFEEYERYSAQPHLGPTSLLTQENLQFLKNTMAELSQVTGTYTQEQIQSSILMDKMVAVAREENRQKYSNLRLLDREISLEKRQQAERERTMKIQEKSLNNIRRMGSGSLGGLGGFSGGYGGGGGGGPYGRGGLPFFMGGGGQAGWVMRQMAWQLAGPVIGSTSIYSVVNRAVKAVKEQEQALINLRRVFNGANQDLYMLGKNITRLAVQYGSVVDQVGQIQEMWAKTGKDTAEQIDTLSKVTLLALNTSEIDNADDAVRFLNSSLMQMGLEWHQAERLLDSWNKTADRFPAATDDFAEAYARAGSYAKALGMDMHELNAIISILVERTGRAGSEIGTALRMILSNIHRPEAIKTLESFGIEVYQPGSSTQFREAMDILSDTAAKFKELETAGASASKVLLATALGQARRRNFAIALLDAWGTVDEVMAASRDSFGYSAQKLELSMESLAFKGNQLQAAFQEMAVSMGEAGLVTALKGIIDAGVALLTWFNNLDPAARNALSWMTLITGTLGTLNTILRQTHNLSLSTATASWVLQLGGKAGMPGAANYMRALAESQALKLGRGAGITREALDPYFGEMFQRDLQGYKALAPLIRSVQVAKGELAVAEKTLEIASKGTTAANVVQTTSLAANTAATQANSTVSRTVAADKVREAQERLRNAEAALAEQTAVLGAARAARIASFATTFLIAAAVSGIVALISHYRAMEERQKKQEEEMRKVGDKVVQLRRLKEEVDELRKVQDKLNEEAETGADVSKKLEQNQADLNNIYKEVARVMPDLVTGVDEYGNAMAELNEQTQKAIESQEKWYESYVKNKALMYKSQEQDLKTRLQEEEAKASAIGEALGNISSLAYGERLKPENERIKYVEVRDPTGQYKPLGETIRDYVPEDTIVMEIPIDIIAPNLYTLEEVQEYLGSQLVESSEEIKGIYSQIQEGERYLEEAARYAGETLSSYKGTNAVLKMVNQTIQDLSVNAENLDENVLESINDIGSEVDYVIKKWGKDTATAKTMRESLKKEIRRTLQESYDSAEGPSLWKTLKEKADDPQAQNELEKILDKGVDAILSTPESLYAWFENYRDQEVARFHQETLDMIAEAEKAEQVLDSQTRVCLEELSMLESVLASLTDETHKIELELRISGLKTHLDELETRKGLLLSERLNAESILLKFLQGADQEFAGAGAGGGSKDPYEALDKRLKNTDHSLRRLQGRLEILDGTWTANAESITYQQEKLKGLHEQEQAFVKALAQTGSELNTLRKNSSNHADKIMELEDRYQDFQKQIIETRNAIYELVQSMREVERAKFDKTIEKLDTALQDIELNAKILAGGLDVGQDSFEATAIEVDKLIESLEILNQQQEETRKEIGRSEEAIKDYQKTWYYAAHDDPKNYPEGRLRQQMEWAHKMAEAEREFLEERKRSLKQYELAIIEAEANVKSFITQLVTTGYEKALQREIELLEERQESEREAHKEWVDSRRKMIEMMRRQWAEEDYDKEMERLRDEEAHLWEQYYRIEHDQTAWAEKRRAEIMHKIREKQREIEEKAEGKRRDDAIQAIEDEIEEREEAFDEKEKLWDEERKGIERHYETLRETAEAKIHGIFLAWQKHRFDVIGLLREMVPEIGLIGEEYRSAMEEGFRLGEDYYKKTTPPGGGGGSPPSAGGSSQSVPMGSGDSQYRLINGTAYMYSRSLGALLGQPVEYKKDGRVYIGGKPISNVQWLDGKTYVPLRNVAEMFGWNVNWPGKGKPITISRYKRGGITPYEGLHYLEAREMVLPQKYTDILDRLIDIPRAILPDLSRLRMNIENHITVSEAIHIDEAYFRDELDLASLEIQAGAQLKRSLRKKGIRTF